MRIILLILLSPLLLLASCEGFNIGGDNSGEMSYYTIYSENVSPPDVDNAFNVIIGNSSMSIDKSVNITMMSPGRTAIVTYRVKNDSDRAIKPQLFTELWRNPKDYKPEYSGPPGDIKEWLKIPEAVEIKPDEVVDIYVSLSIPDDAKVESERWKFAIVVTPGNNEFIQYCASAWWFINMR